MGRLSSQDRQRIGDLVRSRSGVAGHALEASDIDRISATFDYLPAPPASIMDVGCGTGILVDVLCELDYAASGVDTDEGAMSEMLGPHAIGSIDAIPAADRSVDVLVASEVLEHLPVGVYERGLLEMARVAAERVIVTVPNAEPLESASTRCPLCTCVYSVQGHVRRFDPSDMPKLLPGFTLARLDTVGPYKLRHRSVEWYLRRRLLGRWPLTPNAQCPQCGFKQPGSRTPRSESGSALGRVVRFAAGIPWKRWWMVAQYDREGDAR